MLPERTEYERLLAESDRLFEPMIRLMRQQQREPNNKRLAERVNAADVEWHKIWRATIDAKHAMYRAEREERERQIEASRQARLEGIARHRA